ncbi:MAG TPA: RNA polymerase sigma factor [Chitinophagaceae bacterium]|nr:RNA polymerase sigma factor [Chitinophagaceae bacterium]
MSENLTIAALVLGCKQNNRSSQKELYYLFRSYAMSICYRYAHRVEDAEELVNESFIKLFKHIEQFDEERKEDLTMALKAWFKRIIINTCIDRYRKKKQHPDESHLEIASERMADHAENGIDILSYKEIIEAIRLLPPSYRTVFNLFVIEGMTHEQIATRLRISIGASKSNLSKAREQLRKLLTKKSNYNIYVSPQ